MVKMIVSFGAATQYAAPLSEQLELDPDKMLMLSEDPSGSTEDITIGETYYWE